ncbi:MAG: SH3 domain-containing protein [Chloroflexi bacterium]|nr:SH3 domain-containing protein [Chloroflexota bacterium]MCY4248767.1 SH3 domain-containing protein [Chloroflexota bacterium]
MRYALALLLALALALSSLAQDSYTIRLDTIANLREAPGLDSKVAAVLPQGTELLVSGHFNRWLKVVHNDEERWLADWVLHTRLPVNGIAAMYPTTLVVVDNCCLVDRSCATDAEWVRGYYDFRASWCPIRVEISAMSMS